MGGRAERAEAEGNVEAGFAHAAIALVEVAGQSDARGLGAVGSSDVSRFRFTRIHGELRPWIGIRRPCRAVMSEIGTECLAMRQEKIGRAAVVVAGIAHDFRDGTVRVIVVARKPGIAGQVRRDVPLLVVALRVVIGAVQPGRVRVAGG